MKYDKYVFLTEPMNYLINKSNKPYIIIEGLVDLDQNKSLVKSKSTIDVEKVLVYAGGIYEKYGILNLAQAFKRIPVDNIKLHIYGFGEVDNLLNNIKSDLRIEYKGIVSNEILLNILQNATLLINPRPSYEKLALYSFPSKNLEYMASGTPLLTTCLPGMPLEYQSYVYLFNDETIYGMTQKLTEIINFSDLELQKKGELAKNFVFELKNNLVQAERLINFI